MNKILKKEIKIDSTYDRVHQSIPSRYTPFFIHKFINLIKTIRYLDKLNTTSLIKEIISLLK